ncbi:serine/threonine-protein phosphatase 6 regulatory subunit 3 isoform X2 [Euwallacea similis]|uniref:serine/threonine-protein phosphatase 6 regulatory subunit 3 isoform X2 n=1 Tax=Euwallacea similis TaxID=1736056 RepID=UPI00344E915F
MFWKYNTTSSTQIETLLAKEGVTLLEVMDCEDIINECRAQNKVLIDFLLKPEVIEELVMLTTMEPSIVLSDNIRFKYPNIASELLTCDVPAVNERLAGDERLLEKLYTFLESEAPLNPLLASYFSKIMGGLIAKKTEQNWLSYQLTCLQVLDFLKARDTFLPLLMKHLGTSAIMDLMLKLMTQVEGVEMRQNILNWLDSQRIIQQLVCLLNPRIEKERHDNVAQLLCDFLRTSRDSRRSFDERVDPDPLLNTLEAPETVKLLLDQLFEDERSESSIVGGITVLLSLLDVNQTSLPGFRCAINIATTLYNSNINDEAADFEHKQKIVRDVVEAISLRIKDFHQLLLDPPKQSPVLTTMGVLQPPLGNTRLQVVRMLAALIPTQPSQLHTQLINLETFPVILDLFFKYPWNNFLHTQVENCLIAAIETDNNENFEGKEGDNVQVSSLCKHLIGGCNLIERIMKAWKDNDEQQSQKKAIRQGYMGHLISIFNRILPLSRQLKELKPETAAALEEFKITHLAAAIEQQDKLLGGLHPNDLLEDNDEFGDIPFPQSSALQQQSFSQYQMQNLTSQFIDGYSGFNDDAFNDGDETFNQTIDNPSDVNFDLSESEMLQRDAIFKQVCAQNINTLFDADDQVFEEREHTFQTVIEKKDQGNISSDSDDDSPNIGDENMEVDPWTSPKNDPWGVGTTSASSSTTETGWADFSSAAFGENSVFPEAFPAEAKDQLSGEEAQSPWETESKCELKTAQCKNEQICGKIESAEASGDHPHEKGRIEQGNGSSQAQPSKSLQGDSCKKSVEKPLDKPSSGPE